MRTVGRHGAVLVGLVFLLSNVANAEVHTQTVTLSADMMLLGPSSGYGSSLDWVHVSTATPQVVSGEAIVFAEVQLNWLLPPGTVVELWAAGSDSATPDSTFSKAVWVTDERTDPVVRFDVTSMVTAWQSGTLTNFGFVIRPIQVPAEADVAEENSMVEMNQRDISAMTLLYHMGPVEHPSESKDGKKGVLTEDGKETD